MEKQNQISKLNEKLEFYKIEIARLNTESCLCGSPISRLIIEEHKQEALQQIELIKKVIEHISSGIDVTDNETIGIEDVKDVPEEKIFENPIDSSNQNIKTDESNAEIPHSNNKKSISLTNIAEGVIVGFLVVCVIYIFSFYFGIKFNP